MKRFVVGAIVGSLLIMGVSLATNSGVAAVDVFEACQGVTNNPVCDSRQDDVASLIGNVISLLLLLIGVVSVVMIIIGGFRYITANGEASALSSAKNTIMYAVIGLVVALSAYAIVAFVISNI